MKTVTIGEFLTGEQIDRCFVLYPNRARIRDEVIAPNMAEINRKLGQENDPDYLSYAILHTISVAESARNLS